MKPKLNNLATERRGGVAVSPTDPIPERYYVQSYDDRATRHRKYVWYKAWCKARKLECVPLDGMIADLHKPDKNDPIPEWYYIQDGDTEPQIQVKRKYYKDWCKRRGIPFEPLPNMGWGRTYTPKNKAEKKQPSIDKAICDLNKPRWHDTCTTYQDTEKRLAELVQMRDNCHEHTKWQELQSEINALRVKMQSWANEKADRKYTLLTASLQC